MVMQGASSTSGTPSCLPSIRHVLGTPPRGAVCRPMDGRGHKHKHSGTSFLAGTTLSQDVPQASVDSQQLEPSQDALITAPTFHSPSRRSLSRKRSGSLLSTNE